jgi:hypothetical protein
MRLRRMPVPSPAMAVALLALFVALGGTGYALDRSDRAEPSATAERSAKGKRLTARQRAQVHTIVRRLMRRAPPGPQTGATGPAGAVGPAGPAGAPGASGPGGPAGPGAVGLQFDRSPDDQKVALGTVGAWTISARCVVGGVAVPAPLQVFVDGPGTADVTAVWSLNDGTPATSLMHQDLAVDDQIFSVGVRSTDRIRYVGTMVLSAAAAAPVATVSFTLTSDPAANRCAFFGMATVSDGT